MTLEEVRERLEQAAWTRKVPLVDLFDEAVRLSEENHIKNVAVAEIRGHKYGPEHVLESLFMDCDQATGSLVTTLLAYRRDMGLKLYALGEFNQTKKMDC